MLTRVSRHPAHLARIRPSPACEALRRGRIGGTGRGPVGPYPARRFTFSLPLLSTSSLLGSVPPSRALAAGEGWPAAREGGTHALPTGMSRPPRPPFPDSSLSRVRSRGGGMAEGQGGGHLRLAHRDVPPNPHLALLRPSLACSCRGGGVAGGRGEGQSNQTPTTTASPHPNLARLRPSLACPCRGGGMASGQGGGHPSLAQPNASPHPDLARFRPSLACSCRGGGWPEAGERGSQTKRPPRLHRLTPRVLVSVPPSRA